MPSRFFVPSTNIRGDRVTLDDEADLRHIISVLRLRVGEKIIIFSEGGDQYLALIDEINVGRIEARTVSPVASEGEPQVMVTLFQGLAKGGKMDFIIRSTTQLGVGGIVPILTERTVANLVGNRVDSRVSRWAKVAKEATMQSGRSFIPTVERPLILSEAYHRSSEYDTSLLFWEGERDGGEPAVTGRDIASLQDLVGEKRSREKVALFVGPEGGFSPSEVEEALNHGILPISLGPRILRTELAGVVALSLVMYELGVMGVNRDDAPSSKVFRRPI